MTDTQLSIADLNNIYSFAKLVELFELMLQMKFQAFSHFYFQKDVSDLEFESKPVW